MTKRNRIGMAIMLGLLAVVTYVSFARLESMYRPITAAPWHVMPALGLLIAATICLTAGAVSVLFDDQRGALAFGPVDAFLAAIPAADEIMKLRTENQRMRETISRLVCYRNEMIREAEGIDPGKIVPGHNRGWAAGRKLAIGQICDHLGEYLGIKE